MLAMQIGKFKIDFQGKFHSYEYLKLFSDYGEREQRKLTGLVENYFLR